MLQKKKISGWAGSQVYIYVYELNEKKEKARGSDGWVYEDGMCRLGLLENGPPPLYNTKHIVKISWKLPLARETPQNDNKKVPNQRIIQYDIQANNRSFP